ncbi:MAG: alpha/beta hydrolase [Rhizobiales bacterium]|jgi:pimeloyl-ACP methyl ester carboxylesterase|nr:alpha/beta hydrolase [Hyphomicrobiales bacterium]
MNTRSINSDTSGRKPISKYLSAPTALAGIRRAAVSLSAAAFLATTPAQAGVKPWPATFHAEQMPVSDGTQYVRVGGTGPAVVLLHGFGDTGDMWVPLAEVLMKDHTVIVPDLRGVGLSSHPEGGYRKVAQARDLAAILDRLAIKSAVLVTHDIGNMVGYAFAAQYPSRTSKWVVMDAPLPGIGHWDDQLKNPKVWHFNFRGPDVERLVAGRERILLDRFYNELSANPARIDEETRNHYAALYARPHAIHNAFSGQFAAFADDAVDNQKLLAEKGKLTIPVLAIGGDHSYGTSLATEIAFAASRVRAAAIKNSGHWIMEEQPAQAVALITSFIRN